MTTRSGVLFDATGTLFEATESVGEVYARIAREHGVDLPAWRLEDGFRRILRHAGPRGLDGDDEAARREGEVAWWFEIIRQTFQATDSTARFEAFPAFARALFDAYRLPGAWRLRPGIPAVLAALRDRSVPIGVVSNFDHRLLDILENLEIADEFVSVDLPSRHGAVKPDRALFEAAARALERPLAALVYVGDDPGERLAAIAEHGVAVVDVRALGAADDLLPALLSTLEAPTAR
ncbi:MAG: HAD-IA family hydrolase [Myxococcota bacterium]